MPSKIPRANSKQFLLTNSVNTLNCKISTSRMWERKEAPQYNDNWWFKFDEADLHRNEFLLFCGAMDYENKEFRLIKAPTKYVIENLSKIDKDSSGWINLYISFQEYKDLRNKNNLVFKQFLIN